MHLAESILETLKTLLTGLPTTQNRVERDRVFSPEEVPALSIAVGSDRPLMERSTTIDSVQDVVVILQVKERNASTEINKIKAEVFQRLMSDRTLGLPHVINTTWVGDTDPDFSKDAEKPVAKVGMRFSVQYRHSATSKEG